jgi:1,4-dihydroxy-2-naphthoate octaprenyltransferase
LAALRPWAVAARLQFHPMAFLAYWIGALAAAGERGVAAAPFWLGYLAVFLLEAATVFVNDLGDVESDRRNRFWSPLTGGSRVLVTGALSPAALRRGAMAAMAGSLLAILAALSAPPAAPVATVALYGALAVLAIGYTAPPLRLSHRGWGELDVALTHSFGVMLLGAAAQGGAPSDPTPLLLSAPLALAVLPAIILSGVPDREADLAAGKRTLAVRLGVRGALGLAAAAAVAAAAAAAALRHGAGAAALGGLDVVAAPHAAVLLGLIGREMGRGGAARRIDGLLAAALLYIAWFGIVPLIHLL